LHPSFLFTIPSTPETSTLSLHDALPISNTEENIAKGMTPQQARRAARLELGGVEQIRERVRAARMGAWFETLVRDVRFGLRVLRDRKSTRLNSSHVAISYAVFCLKKKIR